MIHYIIIHDNTCVMQKCRSKIKCYNNIKIYNKNNNETKKKNL